MKIRSDLLIALLSVLYQTLCVPSSKFKALKEESRQKQAHRNYPDSGFV